MHEASLCGECLQACSAVCPGHDAFGGCGAAETRRRGRHGAHVLVAGTPKLDELGHPREAPTRWEGFTKHWLVQWQSLVTRFAEKLLEVRNDNGVMFPECGGGAIDV